MCSRRGPRQEQQRRAGHPGRGVPVAAVRVERHVRGEATLVVEDPASERLERGVERDLAALGEADDPDAVRVDARMRGEQAQRGQRIGHVRGGGKAALVGRGLADVAGREAVDHEGGQAEGAETVRPGRLPHVHPTAAVGDHHGGHAGGRVLGQPERADDHRTRGRLAPREGEVAGGGPALEVNLAHPPVGQGGDRRASLPRRAAREPADQAQSRHQPRQRDS